MSEPATDPPPATPGRGHQAPGAPVAPSVLSTLNDDGSRRWLTPRLSRGRYLAARRITAWILILVFTALPHIRINGKPAVLLDLAARRFTFFGTTFLPTDTLLLALLLLAVFVSIFLLTALFGRVWCGWACPQTVYMEFVFRPIERFFDGAPGRVRTGTFTGSPIARVLKYAAFVAVAAVLANTFLAYFVGTDRLWHWVRQSPFEHPAPFMVMAVVTGLMLFDFAFFREQTCIVACPYGRFQSALLDRSSIIVSYDRARGEPRGKARRPARGTDVSLPVARTGDCVDCGLCVATCPTGIDIRNGLQMECVMCAQCIDACDAVMTRLDRPTGLIRYTSQAAAAGEKPRRIRARIIAYPAILAVIVGAFAITVARTEAARFTVIRGMGAPFTELPDGRIANPIKIKLVNRTDTAGSYTIAIEGVAGAELVIEENPIRLDPAGARTVPATIAVPPGTFEHGARPITIALTAPDGSVRHATYRLLGPGHALHHDAPEGHHDRHADDEAPDPRGGTDDDAPGDR